MLTPGAKSLHLKQVKLHKLKPDGTRLGSYGPLDTGCPKEGSKAEVREEAKGLGEYEGDDRGEGWTSDGQRTA